MKKNVKGFIGLFTGIAAFIAIFVSLFALTNPIKDWGFALHGGFNIAMAFVGVVLGIVAIVFGILSRKGRNTEKGPRKAGVIIGVFAVIIALLSAGLCSISKSVADYINHVPGNSIEQMDEASRKPIDDAIEQLEQQLALQSANK